MAAVPEPNKERPMLCRAAVLCPLLCVTWTVAVADDLQKTAVVPTEVVRLSEGDELAHFTTWLKTTGREDPEGVFSAKDGVIRVSGEDAGYLATKHAYRDYHLRLEYKWGEKTDGSGFVRNSGVLVHGTGPDGGARGVWMTSLEVQLAQGCEGDFIVIRGNDENGKTIPATITCDTVTAADKRTRWSRGGTKTVYSGKQFWWSKHQPFFQEKLDTRGKDDLASPVGEWTRVDVFCRGNRVTVQVNGETVNEAYDVFPAAGKILLQNEGNEVFFRHVELRPLPELR
jgi:hypothetical protein